MVDAMSKAKQNDFYVGSNREAMVKALADYLLSDMVDKIERATRCCINCEHWRGSVKPANEHCGHPQANGAKPPAKIIAFGCEMFKDCIPF